MREEPCISRRVSGGPGVLRFAERAVDEVVDAERAAPLPLRDLAAGAVPRKLVDDGDQA